MPHILAHLCNFLHSGWVVRFLPSRGVFAPRMQAMRILLRALALVVTAGVLFIPALAALVPTDPTTTGPDPVRITDYTADYVVTAGGDLVAKEQITTEFPGGRHGIFRFWDVTDPSDKQVRLEPEDVKVQLDGGSVPFDMQWQKGRHFRVAKVG